MSEENKIAEDVKEVNPVDEYLGRYKEQRLAEFCVQKDKEIQNYREERQKFIEQIADMKCKVEKYEKSWSSADMLYADIKNLTINDYLKLYHLFSEDVSGYRSSSYLTIAPSNSFYTTAVSDR